MRYLIILCCLLLSLGIISQSTNNNNYVETRDCEINYDDLDVKFDPSTRVSTFYNKDGSLFNGCAKQDAFENNIYYIHFVEKGKLTRQLGYYYSGKKCRDYNFKNGYPHGLLELFYEDGAHYIREEYKYGKLHGSLKRWKNGQLVREANFWEGVKMNEKLYEVDENKPDRGQEERRLDDC